MRHTLYNVDGKINMHRYCTWTWCRSTSLRRHHRAPPNVSPRQTVYAQGAGPADCVCARCLQGDISARQLQASTPTCNPVCQVQCCCHQLVRLHDIQYKPQLLCLLAAHTAKYSSQPMSQPASQPARHAPKLSPEPLDFLLRFFNLPEQKRGLL